MATGLHHSGFVRSQSWEGSSVGRTSMVTALLIAAGFILNGATGRGDLHGVVSIVDMQQHATPLEGVQITLTPDGQPDQKLSAVTDGEGHYQFGQLSEGAYRLEVNADGFKPFSSDVTIRGVQPQTEP